MKKLDKEFIITEIIPSHSDEKKGEIVQIQALKISNEKIIERFDYRLNEELIKNKDLLKMISYDKNQFVYINSSEKMMKKFKEFIQNNKLLIIDNFYTLDYLKEINNIKESVFKYLNLLYSDDIFEIIMKKYGLEPSNHLVDLLYEALIFESKINVKE